MIVQQSEVERAEVKGITQITVDNSKDESQGEGGQEGGALEIAYAEKIPKCVFTREKLSKTVSQAEVLLDRVRAHRKRKQYHHQVHLGGKESPSSPSRSPHPSSPASPSETSETSGISGTARTSGKSSRYTSHDDHATSVNPQPHSCQHW